MQTFYILSLLESFLVLSLKFYYDYRLIIFSMVFLCSVIQCMIGVTDRIMSVPATMIPYSNRMKCVVIIRAVCKFDTLFWFLIIFSITRTFFI